MTLSRPSIFNWYIPTDGYRSYQVDVDGNVIEFLGEKFPLKREYTVENITDRCPNLFIEFLQLQPRPGNILAFANQYGALLIHGMAYEVQTFAVNKNHTISGEPYSMWINEISEMKRLFNLWELIYSNSPINISKVRSLISFTQDLILFSEKNESKEIILRKNIDTDKNRFNMLFDNHELALREYIRQKFLKKLQNRVNIVPVWESEDNQILRPQPNSLIGALWLQFCMATTEKVRYKECEYCKASFMINSSVLKSRTTKKFCNNNCKLKNHRAKNKGE